MSDAEIAKFRQPVGNKSARELLMRFLQDADQIDELIIMGRGKDGLSFCSGTTAHDKYSAIGLMEVMKHRILGGLGPVSPFTLDKMP